MREIKKRLGKIENLSDSLDGILIFSDSGGAMNFDNPNFFYFSNSDVFGAVYYDFSSPKLYTNIMEKTRAKRGWIKDVRLMDKNFEKEIKNKKIGIDKSSTSFPTLERINKICKTVDISNELEKARIIKTTYEIKTIKESCKITGKIYKKVLPQINKTSTEIELKGLIEYEMHKQGVLPSFPTIVAAGKNSAEPHHVADKTKLKEPIVIDFGIRHRGYISDVTRTISSKEEKNLEKIIQEVYTKIKPGIQAKELDILTRKLMKEKSKYFIHSLGHGIGLAVHEKPWLSSKSTDILKPGMTFTIEPGIYHKEGIRIENDLLLKENGIEILTKF